MKKIHIIGPQGQKNINDLVIYLILPCNILHAFTQSAADGNFIKYLEILLISIGIQVLKNILDVLENDYGLQTNGNRTYQTFYETFDKNVCAGVYVTINFATEFADCPELY